MGMASDIISCFARKPLFGYRPMVYSIMAIAGLGFIVWGHHMFISGMNPTVGLAFMTSTMMIALPSAIRFALGRLIWTSGANVGRVAEVTSHHVVVGARRLKLLEAPVRPIEEGDDFVVRAGCDKRLETCRRRPSSAPPRATAAPSGSSGR
jgi:hypothetical protein